MDKKKEAGWEGQLPYAYWLAGLRGIGSTIKLRLEAYAGSPKGVYGLKQRELQGMLSEAKIKILLDEGSREHIQGKYEELKRRRVGFYPFGHPHYPARLRNCP